MIDAVTDWLVAQGLYQDLLSTAIFMLVGSVLTPFVRKSYHRVLHNQAVIADRLDTTTPGGLADVLEATRKENDCA